MVTLFRFTKHNKDKMLILAHRKINVLYLWLVSLKYIYRLQSYGKSPITSGSPLVSVKIFPILYVHVNILQNNQQIKALQAAYENRKRFTIS